MISNAIYELRLTHEAYDISFGHPGFVYEQFSHYHQLDFNTMKMVNHQNGKETLLDFSEITFGIGLTDDDFSQNALKRAR